MGLFSLTQELAIDLGTANTLIVYNDEVVVDEPSVVAVNVQNGQLEAFFFFAASVCTAYTLFLVGSSKIRIFKSLLSTQPPNMYS